MRLSFDHGTLVLTEAPDFGLEDLPGLCFDPRVGLCRAPAFRYRELLVSLRRRGFQVEDLVRPRPPAPTGPWQSVVLRPYQEEAALSWELAGGRGIVALPTGSGKTSVALSLLASTRARALILVPTRALLQQWLSVLGLVYAGPLGCIGDGRHAREAITVCTFESAYRHMPRIGRHFELLIVDEAHHFGNGVRDEALEMCVAEHRLGLTATPPEGPALSRLGELLGPIVYGLTVADLKGRWLADFDQIVLRLALDAEERERYAADYQIFSPVNREFRRFHPLGSWQDFVAAASQSPQGRAALAAWRRARRLANFNRAKARAVRALLVRHRDSKVLVFTADNETAYAVAREHLVMPITCEVGRAERKRALEAYRCGDLRTLVSARVLNEGIDVPDADVAVIVGGTQGKREHVQRIGRLLRPAPGKRARVYELVTMATSEARHAAERRRGLAA
jgi:superfamily II DNA or RNA helicase